MGRYYRVGLKDKSEKNINRVNQILEQEFDAPVKIHQDGFRESIFISNKYLKEEFDYVKNNENYKQFSFASQIKQSNLDFKSYCSQVEFVYKKGYSLLFKISCLHDMYEAKRVIALSEMVDSEKYEDLFVTQNSRNVKYETSSLVYSYSKHFLKNG